MDTILAATPNGALVQALNGASAGRRKVVPVRSVVEAERVLGRDCGVAIVDARCDFALDLLRKIKVDAPNGVARMPVVLIDGDGSHADFQILTEERVSPTADARQVAQLVEDIFERRKPAGGDV